MSSRALTYDATYAERAHFLGDHCSHVVDYEDHLTISRLERKWQRAASPRRVPERTLP